MVGVGETRAGHGAAAAAAGPPGVDLEAVHAAGDERIVVPPNVAVGAIAGDFEDASLDAASFSAGQRPAGGRRFAGLEPGLCRCHRRRIVRGWRGSCANGGQQYKDQDVNTVAAVHGRRSSCFGQVMWHSRPRL